MVVSAPGFCSLKYRDCLMLALQQKPEQNGRCPSLSLRWPAHWTKATDPTSLPSDGRLMGPSPAWRARSSSSAWVTTSGDLP